MYIVNQTVNNANERHFGFLNSGTILLSSILELSHGFRVSNATTD